MGAHHPRYQGNSTEFAIGFAEAGLEMSHLNVISLNGYLYKYSHRGVVNQDQMQYLAKIFKFKLQNYEQNKGIEKFWDKVKDNENFNVQFLHVLGIMLTLGDVKTKSELLFEVFDEKLVGELSVGKLQEMLETMVEVVSSLGYLVYDGQTIHSNTLRTLSHIQELNSVSHAAIHEILKNLLDLSTQTHISKDSFIDKFSQINDGRLLDTVGFRLYLSHFLSTRSSKYSNPFKPKQAN